MRAAWLVVAALATAQTLPPAFEVASVKPSASRDAAMRINWPRGRFSAVNVTTRQFIQAAYVLQPFRLEGGPAWMNADRFNIEATVNIDVSLDTTRGMPEPIRLMMQRLLEERFMFASHWETKSKTVYALVRATPSRSAGPNLQKSSVDCRSLFNAVRRGAPASTLAPCSNQSSPGRIKAGGLLLAQFADMLTSTLQQLVFDRTGLDGGFDIELAWSPDPTVDGGPSLFTALQEQLALKLEATKAPVDVLIVDRLLKPSAD